MPSRRVRGSRKDHRCRKCGQLFSSTLVKCPRCFPALQVSLTQDPLNSQNLAFAENYLSVKSQRASSRLVGRGIVLLVLVFFLVGYFFNLSGWAWVSAALLVLLLYGCLAYFGPVFFYVYLFDLDKRRGVADILQARVEGKWRVAPSGEGILFVTSLFSFMWRLAQATATAKGTHDEEGTHEEVSTCDLIAETLGEDEEDEEQEQNESQSEAKPGGFWEMTPSEQELWEKCHPDHFEYYLKIGGRNFKTEVFAWYRVAIGDWVRVRFMRHSEIVLTVTQVTEQNTRSF